MIILGDKMDFKTRDYSDLNGKKVIYRVEIEDTGEIKDHKAVVVGIDYHVGVSIALAEEQVFTYPSNDFLLSKKGQEMFCLNGELSPNRTSLNYNKVFKEIVEMIEEGVIDFNYWVTKRTPHPLGMAACAFK